jgi:cell division protein FtsL
MKRSITIAALIVLAVVAYGLYNLKYKVEDLQEHAEALREQMDEDRRAIKVLEAEYAYLSRPERLQRLATKFLDLGPTAASQVGDMADLRLKPVPGLDAEDPVVDSAEADSPKAGQQSAEAYGAGGGSVQ